jgi:hypothetical protein
MAMDMGNEMKKEEGKTKKENVVKRDRSVFEILSTKNVSKRFFSKTTWTIETKLPRNDHWKVLYKIYVFYADWKSLRRRHLNIFP